MNAIQPLTDAVSSILPAYPADTVASVSDGIGDAVLWSGPTMPSAAIDAMVLNVGLCVLASLGITALFVRAMARGRVHVDSMTCEETYHPSPLALPFLALLFCPMILGMSYFGNASRASSGAVVVTASRVILLNGKDSRTDIPASSVTRVDREDGKVTLRFTGHADVEIVPSASAIESLDGAVTALTTRIATR